MLLIVSHGDQYERGHPFSTCARRGEGGMSKSVHHAYKGGRGADTSKYVCKKSLLSYFVVYGDHFHCCAKKHLL